MEAVAGGGAGTHWVLPVPGGPWMSTKGRPSRPAVTASSCDELKVCRRRCMRPPGTCIWRPTGHCRVPPCSSMSRIGRNSRRFVAAHSRDTVAMLPSRITHLHASGRRRTLRLAPRRNMGGAFHKRASRRVTQERISQQTIATRWIDRTSRRRGRPEGHSSGGFYRACSHRTAPQDTCRLRPGQQTAVRCPCATDLAEDAPTEACASSHSAPPLRIGGTPGGGNGGQVPSLGAHHL